MSYPDPNRYDGSKQSIPLQNLNGPPVGHDGHYYNDPGSRLRRPTLSDRGRNLLRQVTPSGQHRDPQYVPIADGSPSPTRHAFGLHVQNNPHFASEQAYDNDGDSPIDTSAFQAALGMGMGFHDMPPPLAASSFPIESESENPAYANMVFDDRARLTDIQNLQLISGTSPPPSPAPDRTSFQSVRFLSPGPAPRVPRQGHDIGRAEANVPGPRRQKHRLSAAQPGTRLQRASTIVRNISQRVVNVSNDSEVAERTLQRKSTAYHARLAEPPSLPALPEYATDGPSPSINSPAFEKSISPVVHHVKTREFWQRVSNPLRGKSLGIFSPHNKFRMMLCDLLVHPVTEPIILTLIIVQTILLAVDARKRADYDPHDSKRFSTFSPIDYALMGLFIVYTVEIAIRIIVSGLVINPLEHSTIDRRIGLRQALGNKMNQLFGGPERQPSKRRSDNTPDDPALGPQQPSVLRSFTTAPLNPELGDPREQQRARLAHRAYLRHSFNRTDFLAVSSYWTAFLLSAIDIENKPVILVFNMLSCLRIIRLLNLTSGTSVILRSLKKAAPLLVNVAFLIGFFWLLFSILGVQAFKSSLRRNCVWIDPEGEKNVTNDQRFCGGHLLNISGKLVRRGFQAAPGRPQGPSEGKGFLCPVGSMCIEAETGGNPFNNTQSFDNIFQSLELVFVIMSSNTWAQLLYQFADTDYLISSLYFIGGILILSLWLISLLIAVITSSFQIIREANKRSAFTGEEIREDEAEQEQEKYRISGLKRLYDKTRWIWVVVITYGLISQTLTTADMNDVRKSFISMSELVVTLVLLVEILIRFTVDWRQFFKSKQNIFDLMIAVITTIIQIPAIKEADDGTPYAWLTVFQIVRVYRIVMAVPATRDLIMILLGNIGGLLNLMVFVFLLTFLASIFASQLFRGEIPETDETGEAIHVPFFDIYNCFIGMYQILSSENWTEILYNVTSYQEAYGTAWIGATFCILWFIFANFIVLNMFIAVIQENFDVSEDEKRIQQVKSFLQHKEQAGPSTGNLSLSSIFKLGSAARRDPLDYGSAATEMLLKDAVVHDFLDEGNGNEIPQEDDPRPVLRPARTLVGSGDVSTLWAKFLQMTIHREPNPFYAPLDYGRAYEDLDPRRMAKEVVIATERRKKAQREYLRKHPRYNVSLFIFEPSNPVRRFCQRIVGPGHGDRVEGVAPSVPIWYAFSAFIYATITAMVLLACITTPLYQREYFTKHPFSVKNWFVWTDMGFAIIFTIEALIKVIADGCLFTPNAYFRGSWGFIDGFVLITLWVSIATSLLNEGQITRTAGAFKALRALRLLNISDSARDHFHSLIILGWWKLISAALLSLSLLIPFAIYGLNLFVGRMKTCNDNDSGISDLTDCVGEFSATPFSWNVLSPRQASNPFYDFDNFGNSLFILFQILSQEGWIDVLWTAMSITGDSKQPEPFAAVGNSLFFIVFNLLGAVFVLTLFVSVFMRNYTEQTGVAFLTTDQRSWLELRKLLRRVSPSKRPSSAKRRETWEEWCYHRAVRKGGRWHKFITGILTLHLVLLCLEWYPGNSPWETTRDYIFLCITVLFITNLIIRIIGLSWHRFRKSSWDIFSVFAVTGTFVSSILILSNNRFWAFNIVHKLFLVSIALLLIPRNNQLDQLFKTAAASLGAIASLLATWFVLFLVFAIALTQTFGLTRFGGQETGNINFRTVPKALIFLFTMSTGEGWNEFMEDFATMKEPFCTAGERYFESDCGSPEWARALFVSWNILSQYIFVNLFVSLIFESFSYVYQRSSGLSIISREEIRRFKQAWAEFDPDGRGYISKADLPRLLGELSGIFEMRIYDGDFTVGRLIEQCSTARRESHLVGGREQAREIDIRRLNRCLRNLPVHDIRRRRARMNRFYEEVLVSSDPDRGIQFTSFLMILAHYKIINDNKSLRLEEFLRRRARLQRVEEAVRRNVVVGFFDTLYWSRRFRRFKESKKQGRMAAVPQFTVPEIFVEDEDITDNQLSRGTSSGTVPFALQYWHGPESHEDDMAAGEGRSWAQSIQHNPMAPPTGPSLQALHPHTAAGDSDLRFSYALSGPPNPLEVDTGSGNSRNRPAGAVSAADVREALDNSVWGESIRRSYTHKRRG